MEKKKSLPKGFENIPATEVVDIIQEVNDIIDEVEWGKVHKAMKALDWGWATAPFTKDGYVVTEIPDERALRAEARRIALNAIGQSLENGGEGWTVFCGGIETHAAFDDGVLDASHLALSVKFVVSFANNYDE